MLLDQPGGAGAQVLVDDQTSIVPITASAATATSSTPSIRPTAENPAIVLSAKDRLGAAFTELTTPPWRPVPSSSRQPSRPV